MNIIAVFRDNVIPTHTSAVTPTPTIPDFIYGDVNNNTLVNSIDFAFFRKYLLGMIKNVDIDTSAADVDGNGCVNSIDFGYVRQYLLGIIKKLPASK